MAITLHQSHSGPTCSTRENVGTAVAHYAHMQLQEFSSRAASEKSQRKSVTATKPVASKDAIDEISAYIAIRDNLLAEAEATTTSTNLRRLRLANDFVQSCLKPVRSPYERQFLLEPDAERERERCKTVKIRINQLQAQTAL